MMQKYFLFFIIISYTYCKIIYFWRGRGLELTPEKTDTNYAYIKTEEFDYYEEIELTFTDNGTSFCYNELEICYTNEEPLNESTISNCTFKTITYFKKNRILNHLYNGTKYYYRFGIFEDMDNKISKNYIIIHYRVNFEKKGNIYLNIMNYYHSFKKDEPDNTLPIKDLITIIVMSIVIFLSIVSLVAMCILNCRKSKASHNNNIMENKIEYSLNPPEPVEPEVSNQEMPVSTKLIIN